MPNTGTVIPYAQGVPGAGGPPTWWLPRDDKLEKRIEDPRWQGAAGATFPTSGNGILETASFRVLYYDNFACPPPVATRTLYLSLWVRTTPRISVTDTLWVAIASKAANGGRLLLRFRPASAGATRQVAERLAGVQAFEYKSGTQEWADISTPKWVHGHDPTQKNPNPPGGRQWIDPGGPEDPKKPREPGHQGTLEWAINLQIPLIDSGTVTDDGINLGDKFQMWYQIQSDHPANAGMAPYAWPRGMKEIEDQTQAPKPGDTAIDAWGDFRLGTGEGDGFYSEGVSITSGDIGIDFKPDKSLIEFDPNLVDKPNDPPGKPVINYFYARPLNTGSPIAADNISATFKMANWGSQNAKSDAELWTPIRTLNNVVGRDPIPTNKHGNLTGEWTLDKTEIKAFYPPATATRDPHNCILVELHGTGLNFIRQSTFSNFIVQSINPPRAVDAELVGEANGPSDPRQSMFGRFSRTAEINVAELPPVKTAKRDVYLYVETVNMPKDQRPSGPAPKVAALHSRLEAGEPVTIAELTETLPSYRVHVWHDTGRTFRRNGKTVPVLEPQTSFGYAFVNSDDSHGWDTALRGQGLERLAPNYYRVRIAPDKPLRVSTKVVSWNRPRPWWWELWEFLMDLWDHIADDLRNPHHAP